MVPRLAMIRHGVIWLVVIIVRLFLLRRRVPRVGGRRRSSATRPSCFDPHVRRQEVKRVRRQAVKLVEETKPQ